MNFLDMCYEVFTNTSKYHDLGKDIDNLNKLNSYLTNYYAQNLYLTNRQDIENFIVEVRLDNPVYSAMCQLIKVANSTIPIRPLQELSPNELFIELQGEVKNVILKGAYDSIKLLYHLDEQQSKTLATRIATEDMTIFTDYRC